MDLKHDLVFVPKPLACSMSCMWKHLKAVHRQLILGVHLKWESHSFNFSGELFQNKKASRALKLTFEDSLGKSEIAQVPLALSAKSRHRSSQHLVDNLFRHL